MRLRYSRRVRIRQRQAGIVEAQIVEPQRIVPDTDLVGAAERRAAAARLLQHSKRWIDVLQLEERQDAVSGAEIGSRRIEKLRIAHAGPGRAAIEDAEQGSHRTDRAIAGPDTQRRLQLRGASSRQVSGRNNG